MHNTLDYKCDICGAAAITALHLEENLMLCISCSSQLHTCRGCAKRANCALEKNEFNLPLYIIQTQQTQRGTVQIQVPNPELVSTYCSKCICGHSNGAAAMCMRQLCGTCNNWELHDEYKKNRAE